MEVLITGANGFIGSNLCRHFLRRGWKVYGLVRRTSDLHFLDGLDVQLVTGDLADAASFSLPPTLDALVHAASIVSDTADDAACDRDIYQLAVTVCRKLGALAGPPPRLVYVSTALTLGFNGVEISDERPGEPADFLPYTRHKIRAERFVLDEWRQRGLPAVILRPADVYGPNDRTSCARMLRACERGAPLIVGHGNWRFGYCWVGNLCQAADLAVTTAGIEGRAYTVTNRELPTWRTFFEGLQRGLRRPQHLYVPVPVAYALASAMQGVRRLRPSYEPPLTYYRIRRVTTETTYDIGATVRDLGYRPDDALEPQIDAIVSWYREERAHGHIR
jgi:nucleoside-diphosphate-sugar epimerase